MRRQNRYLWRGRRFSVKANHCTYTPDDGRDMRELTDVLYKIGPDRYLGMAFRYAQAR